MASQEHLNWVKNNLSQDLVKQREDEILRFLH